MLSLDDGSVLALVYLDVMLDHLEYRRFYFELSVYFVIKLVITFRKLFREFFIAQLMINSDSLEALKVFITLAFALLTMDDYFPISGSSMVLL